MDACVKVSALSEAAEEWATRLPLTDNELLQRLQTSRGAEAGSC